MVLIAKPHGLFTSRSAVFYTREHFLTLSPLPSSLFRFLPPCLCALTLRREDSRAGSLTAERKGHPSTWQVPSHLRLCRSKVTLSVSPSGWQTASAGRGVLVLRSLSKIYDLLNALLPFALAQISPCISTRVPSCWALCSN